MKIVTRAVALLLAAMPVTAADAAVVINGSFEQGLASVGSFTTLGTNSTAITGWRVTSGSVDIIGSYWNHSDGRRSLDLSGNQAGTIAQMIPTIAGKRYTVSFDISSNPDRAFAKSMLVGFGTATPVAVTFSSPITRPLQWQTVSLRFVADAPTTQLSFRSTTPGAWGMALDNVSAVIPEPATWTMLITGFAFIGASLRDRRAPSPARALA